MLHSLQVRCADLDRERAELEKGQHDRVEAVSVHRSSAAAPTTGAAPSASAASTSQPEELANVQEQNKVLQEHLGHLRSAVEVHVYEN